jgi:hypothetical protein
MRSGVSRKTRKIYASMRVSGLNKLAQSAQAVVEFVTDKGGPVMLSKKPEFAPVWLDFERQVSNLHILATRPWHQYTRKRS